MAKRKIKKMILDKIQYSFIYFMYKSYRVKHRRGKGYQYIKYTDGAHRIISLLFTLTALIVSSLITGKQIGSDINIVVAIGALLIAVIYLDFSVSKKKMLKYRDVYANNKRYIFYYVLILAGAIIVSLIYSML